MAVADAIEQALRVYHGALKAPEGVDGLLLSPGGTSSWRVGKA